MQDNIFPFNLQTCLVLSVSCGQQNYFQAFRAISLLPVSARLQQKQSRFLNFPTVVKKGSWRKTGRHFKVVAKPATSCLERDRHWEAIYRTRALTCETDWTRKKSAAVIKIWCRICFFCFLFFYTLKINSVPLLSIILHQYHQIRHLNLIYIFILRKHLTLHIHTCYNPHHIPLFIPFYVNKYYLTTM